VLLLAGELCQLPPGLCVSSISAYASELLKMITLEVTTEKNVLKTTNSLIAHAALPVNVMLLINILGVKCCLPCLLDVVRMALPSQKVEGS
jgi:hypothetical protein